MVNFPDGTPTIPDIEPLDPPGSAGGGVGIRTIINDIKDNTLALIDAFYNGSDNDFIALNGGPLVWQEEVTYAAAASGTYPAEMWRYLKAGAIVHTINQSTDVPAISDSTQKIMYSIHLDVTTADASLAAGDFCILEYLMEGFRFNSIAQREFTIRFWVKAAKTGIHCVAFRNSSADRTYVAEYTINAADTWEEKSITVPASPAAGGWNYTVGTGLRIDFTLFAGTTFQAAAGAWASNGALCTANQVNEGDNTNNNFRICGLRIAPGSYCPPFHQIPYSIEQFLCWRYFYKKVKFVVGFGQVYDATAGAGQCIIDLPLPNLMRSLPALTVSSLSAFTFSRQNFLQTGAPGAVAIYGGDFGVSISLQCTAIAGSGFGAAGDATMMLTGGGAGYLAFNSRLT